jgi:hypothetical protein
VVTRVKEAELGEIDPIVLGRVLLGLVFSVFGLNGLLHILPLPPAQGAAAVFIRGLMASRYFFPLLFIVYVFSGAGLLIGRFVPLALTIPPLAGEHNDGEQAVRTAQISSSQR